jgi:hypothetical protein
MAIYPPRTCPKLAVTTLDRRRGCGHALAESPSITSVAGGIIVMAALAGHVWHIHQSGWSLPGDAGLALCDRSSR